MNIIIALDGADGTGKTTIANKLYCNFTEVFAPERVRKLKFPSGDIYERLTKGDPLEAKDFLDDMQSHLAKPMYINSPYVKGSVTILDRSFLTTAVYQGFTFPNQPDDSLERWKPKCKKDNRDRILLNGINIFKKSCDLFVAVRIYADHEVVASRIIERLEEEAAKKFKDPSVALLSGKDDTERVYINWVKLNRRHRAAIKLENHVACIDDAFCATTATLKNLHHPDDDMKVVLENYQNNGRICAVIRASADTIAKSLCAKYAPLVLKEVDDV